MRKVWMISIIFFTLVCILVAYRMHAVWIDKDLAHAYLWLRDTTPEDSNIIVPPLEKTSAGYYSRRQILASEAIFKYGAQDSLSQIVDPVYLVVTEREFDRLHLWGVDGADPYFFHSIVFSLNADSNEIFLEGERGSLLQVKNSSGSVIGYKISKNHDTSEYLTVGRIFQDGLIVSKNGSGCVLILNMIMYLDDPYCDAPIIHLLAGIPVPEFELWYDKDGIKIYEYVGTS